MPFDSPPPPDPDNRPWLDVLHLPTPDPERCYHSESRWGKEQAARASRVEQPSGQPRRVSRSA